MSGPLSPPPGRGDREARLEALREEARRTGRVEGAAGPIAGGPLPRQAAARSADTVGYYGRPIVKPPVWTWEIPVYFFVGGLAGMAAVIALAATVTGVDAALEPATERGRLVRTALWLAVGGSLVSAALLVSDLGRPTRFLNMLRVFKWRSAMSMGAWTLSIFGAAATAALSLLLVADRWDAANPVPLLEAALLTALGAAALSGAVLATYTGVLLGVTAVPAWLVHVRSLPLHFGIAGLGAAAAALELLGFGWPALNALGLGASGAETLYGAWIELRRNGPADRALRDGRPGLFLRTGGFLAGPVALLLRLMGLVLPAAAAFLVGALLGRLGWLAAGRASGADPLATLALQHPR